MKYAHTPGPLTVCDPGDYGDFDGNSIVILSSLPHRVAVVQGSDKEAIANAHLFAASPDLLTAAECVESLIPHLVDLDDNKVASQALFDLRKAIAKAKRAAK